MTCDSTITVVHIIVVLLLSVCGQLQEEVEEEEENKEEEEAEDVLDSELIHLCAHINVNFVRYTKTVGG